MNEKLEMSEKNKENKENVYTGVKDKENIREIRGKQKNNRKRRVSLRKKTDKLKKILKRTRRMLIQEWKGRKMYWREEEREKKQ